MNLKYLKLDEVDPGAADGSGGAVDNSSWQLGLPDDIRDHASMGKFSDIGGLAKSYINLESMVGKDKLVLPQTDDQWSDVYNKLGRPGAGSEYIFENPKDFAESDLRTAESDTAIKDAMHGLGLNQNQAAGMSDYLYSVIQANNDAGMRDAETARFDITQELTREYGAALEQKLAAGRQVIKEFGGDEALKVLTDHNFGNNASIIKMFAKLSESVLGDSGLLNGESGVTPNDIKTQIADLRAKPGFMDRKSPDHNSIIKNISSLSDQLHSTVA